MLDIWNQYLLAINSDGILPTGWFLFTYELCILISFPIYHCFESRYGKYALIIVDIILIVLLALGYGKFWQETMTQALWIHIYFTYFLTGMIIAKIDKTYLEKFMVFILSLVSFIVSSLIFWHNINNFGGLPHQYYGKGYYTIWVISFFIMITQCLRWNISPNAKKVIKLCANNTFTVYLGHLPILLFVEENWPFKGVLDASVCVVILFCGLTVVSEIFRKMPLLRRLV